MFAKIYTSVTVEPAFRTTAQGNGNALLVTVVSVELGFEEGLGCEVKLAIFADVQMIIIVGIVVVTCSPVQVNLLGVASCFTSKLVQFLVSDCFGFGD